jgi:hypothetical protein
MTISKNTFFLNNNKQIYKIPDDIEYLIIDGIITKNLDNLPITLKGIYFTNSAYKFSINKSTETNNIVNIKNGDEGLLEIRNGNYFDFVSPTYHKDSLPDAYINVYSFSLYPENISIYVKVPFNCKIYNNQLNEIENFDGYVLVEYYS